jgi:hypothetical protein
MRIAQQPLIGKDVTIAQLRSRDNAAWMAKNGVALNQQLDANRAKYKGKSIPNMIWSTSSLISTNILEGGT